MRNHFLIPAVALCLAADAAAQRGTTHSECPASSANETGFPSGAEWTHSGPGADFLQVSYSTRTAGLASPNVTCPFSVTVPAPPPGATLVDAIVSWTYLADDNPMTDPVMINGNPITGAQLGWGSPDLCWGKDFGVTYMVSGVANLLNIGGLNDFSDMCDGPVGTDSNALGEGVTVILIFEDPTAPATIRTVDVFSGYTSSQSSGTGAAKAVLDLSCAYAGGPFHFFVNADDGQFADDLFLINGVNVGGLVNGTFSAGDAWVGLAGPAANQNLYDAADDDISTWVTPGDTSVTIESGFGSDCVAHSLAACAYEPDASCDPCSIIPFCNPFTGSFDNTATITPDACSLGNPILLTLHGAPPNEAAYLSVGNGQSLIVNPPDTMGDLCVAGGSFVARYAKDLGMTDATGSLTTDISNTLTGGPNFGLPLGAGNIQPGDTFYFQYWHRNPQGPTGFSEAVCVTFK